eukprot:1381770-Amorphochlora_amoeboformis.AAC.1
MLSRPALSRSLSRALSTAVPSTYVEGFHEPELTKKMRYRPLGGRCVDTKGNPMIVSILSLGGSSFGGIHKAKTASIRIAYGRLWFAILTDFCST